MRTTESQQSTVALGSFKRNYQQPNRSSAVSHFTFGGKGKRVRTYETAEKN